MNFQAFFKKYAPHLIGLAICFIVMMAYFSPVLGGKVLKQFDVRQWRASYQEIHAFQQATGEKTYWTNSIFSGMPGYLIGASYSYNASSFVYQLIGRVLSDPLQTMVLLYVCFYIIYYTSINTHEDKFTFM